MNLMDTEFHLGDNNHTTLYIYCTAILQVYNCVYIGVYALALISDKRGRNAFISGRMFYCRVYQLFTEELAGCPVH